MAVNPPALPNPPVFIPMKLPTNILIRLFSFSLRFALGWLIGLIVCLFQIYLLTVHWIPLKFIGLSAVLGILLGFDILYQFIYRWYRKFKGLPQTFPLFGTTSWPNIIVTYRMSQYLLPLGLLFALPVIVFCLDFRFFPTILFAIGEFTMSFSVYRLSKNMDHDPVLRSAVEARNRASK